MSAQPDPFRLIELHSMSGETVHGYVDGAGSFHEHPPAQSVVYVPGGKTIQPVDLLTVQRDLRAETAEVEAEDGRRNAALFATREAVAQRFIDHEQPDLQTEGRDAALREFGDAYRVAEAYRVQVSAAMDACAARPSAVTAEQSHLALSQYAAATARLSETAERAAVHMFYLLESELTR